MAITSYLNNVCSDTNVTLYYVWLLFLPSIDVEIYFSHRLFVRPISFVSVHSLRLSCRRSNTPRQFCVCAFSPSFLQAVIETRRWPNVGLLLAHCVRRSANISAVLGHRIVFDATLNVGQRHRRRANINLALGHSIVTVTPTCRYLLYVCGFWSSRQARSVRPVLVQCWTTHCGAESVLSPALGGRICCFAVMTMGAIAQ